MAIAGSAQQPDINWQRNAFEACRGFSMHSTFSRPIALILLILLPLLGGCVAAVTAGAIATGSSVHDRRIRHRGGRQAHPAWRL